MLTAAIKTTVQVASAMNCIVLELFQERADFNGTVDVKNFVLLFSRSFLKENFFKLVFVALYQCVHEPRIRLIIGLHG